MFPVKVNSIPMLFEELNTLGNELINLIISDRLLQVRPSSNSPDELALIDLDSFNQGSDFSSLPIMRIRPCRNSFLHDNLYICLSHGFVDSGSIPIFAIRTIWIWSFIQSQKGVIHMGVREDVVFVVIYTTCCRWL